MRDLESFLISHFGHEVFTPGLERISFALGEDLIAFLNQKKIITIAGTNGKGETTLRLSHYLGRRRHCVWTSPHIERITERFRSEEGEIDASLLGSLVERLFVESRERNYQLSYYEFLFLVFCHWVRERNPEFILLEVGLGGRLDAVNALSASVVLLPSLSRDHQEILGKRYDQILAEKLGVLRKGAKLITFLEGKYLRERASEHCRRMGGECTHLEDHWRIPGFEFSKRNDLLAREGFKSVIGEFPFEERIELSGRGETLSCVGEWYLSGAHNVDGMRKLIQFLLHLAYSIGERKFDFIIAAFSKRDSKDLRVMMKMLKLLGAKKVIVTTFNHPKAASSELIEELSRKEGLEFVQDIESIAEAFKDHKTLVTGSYYFIGDFKSTLRRRITSV